MGRILIGVIIGFLISSMTLNIYTDDCESIEEKLEKQGRKMGARYQDRPNARRNYERRMILLGAATILFLIVSVLCIINTIGDWQT